MDDIAIKVEHVSKTFQLPHEKAGSIKNMLINFSSRKKGYEKQQVLDDISFDIKKGEFFGIVGRNGSGKSTLLKLLAGIYAPTSGQIQINGKLTPFIELGVGFNPELTGRENVFLNGALLGFNRTEMAAMYDDIVKFAELERFMDQKLKNYSSGMQVRLAFSIAIRAESDILLLDEVLAVGDEAFQRKCYSYFGELKRNGKTVVLVTHDMSAVEKYCSRAMFIEDGVVKLIGNPHEAANEYSLSNDAAYRGVDVGDMRQRTSGIDIKLCDKNGKPKNKFYSGDEVMVKLAWPQKDVKNVGVAIFKQTGEYVYGTNTYVEKISIPRKKDIIYKLKPNLVEGEYFLRVGLFGQTDEEHIDFEENGPKLIISRNLNDPRWQGLVKLESEWK